MHRQRESCASWKTRNCARLGWRKAWSDLRGTAQVTLQVCPSNGANRRQELFQGRCGGFSRHAEVANSATRARRRMVVTGCEYSIYCSNATSDIASQSTLHNFLLLTPPQLRPQMRPQTRPSNIRQERSAPPTYSSSSLVAPTASFASTTAPSSVTFFKSINVQNSVIY